MLLIVDGGQFVRFVVNVICEETPRSKKLTSEILPPA
jgi:hypothetical protein